MVFRQSQDSSAAPALAATWGVGRWSVAIIAGLLAAFVTRVPAVDSPMRRLHSWIANPTDSRRRTTALLIGLVAFGYLVLTAHLQDRDLFPKTHDEQAYWLQTRMLAAGRLWMPQHPLADFFDTFYVISRPVTAAQYFVGTAMMNVPAVWLGLPSWVIPAMVAAGIVALIYRIFAELIDGSAGLLAAAITLSLSWFRVYSMLVMGHEPLLLLGLLLTWGWLNWRTHGGKGGRWPLLMGTFAGWAAITRPVDALSFAVPIGVAIVFDIWKRQTPKPARAILRVMALSIAGAVPFLTLQAICNKGVTGSFLDTPFSLYSRTQTPGVGYFSSAPADATPQSPVLQKSDHYRQVVQPYLARHADSGKLARAWWTIYLPMSADTALPCRPAIGLVLAGVVLLRPKGRWAVAAVLPLLLLALVPYTFFLEHYALVLIPAALMLTLLGIRAVSQAAGPAAGIPVRAFLSTSLLTISLVSLPELNPLFGGEIAETDETFPGRFMRTIREDVPPVLQKPAIVLFRYSPGDRVYEEPVYNTDAAWPDDCPVIYAHDLGPRNSEIIQYYAKLQPDRMFYTWDRRTNETHELGTAKNLAAKMP